ncbi:MAG: Glyoxalase/bleomycin resistance protein/dioxygenase [Tardiphaga sp.]|uniref:VOC family protein n=1 Tax=Tardiphaga sp. TaxID=1926292 RepID=UPI0026313DF4|nr:VOC family protein [Tardiphaga sp.]MDB5503354.1 Glyoxalase/bleomycin resistance protein/dioxygenase [Tardiphaga sp.]
MQINPYVHYNGNCEEALNFYVKAIGAKIDVLMHVEGSPAAAHMPPEMAKKVLHSQFSIDGEVVMASDAAPEYFRQPQGFSISLNMEDPAEGEKIFHALADGGTVLMPFGATFWSKGFGMCVDKFGIPWMVNCAMEP